MLERVKARLVADARDWWKWSSVQFALVGGAVTSWAATDPKGFAQIIGLLPEALRPAVGVMFALLAIGLRITKKKEA